MSKTAVNDKSNINAPQCLFFVLRKKRLCRMTVKPGKQYCGEHEPQPKSNDGKDDTRIPCPNDPKHTCYASKLEKHLTICNARPQEQPVYIIRNINAPTEADDFLRLPLSKIPLEKILKVIEKVNILYDKNVKDNITTLPEKAIHSAVLEDFQMAGRTDSSLRHLRQASRLLHLMEEEQLVDPNTCFVELGAGKGHLSYYAWRAWCQSCPSRVLLVDRASLRHKRDNKLRGSEGAGGAVQRIRADLAHLHLEMVPYVASAGCVVGYAKHLCGVATDKLSSAAFAIKKVRQMTDVETARLVYYSYFHSILSYGMLLWGSASDINSILILQKRAVRYIYNLRARDSLQDVFKDADYALRCVAAARRARGLVLATCCHHRCQRSALAAALQDLGIDPEEFDVMLGIVSWATCGDGRSRYRRQATPPETRTPPETGAILLNLQQEQRELVGRKAKALIDWGRVLYLREKGFQARLVHYVPPGVSLENVCIVAKKVI